MKGRMGKGRCCRQWLSSALPLKQAKDGDDQRAADEDLTTATNWCKLLVIQKYSSSSGNPSSISACQVLWKFEPLGRGLVVATGAGGLSMALMAASSSASVESSVEFSGVVQTLLNQGRKVLVDETRLSANRTTLGLAGSTSASAGVVLHCRGPVWPWPSGWHVHLMPK